MINRDRWGRPLIPDPVTGETVWHHRPSSLGRIIEDSYGLEQWAQRTTAVGCARRPDLLALVSALDPTAPADKRQLNKLVGQLKDAGGASDGANTGTAIHAYTEQIDRGQTVEPLPEFVADLDAYQQALTDHSIEIDPAWIERFIVWPEKRIAGSADRFVRYRGEWVVLDLKTGQHNPASFSLVSHAAQLAAYAYSSHTWDGDKFGAMPAVSHELGLILWLPAGQAKAELIEVDLVDGAAAVDLALDVYAMRKNKAFGKTAETPFRQLKLEDPKPPPVASRGDHDALRARLKTMQSDNPSHLASVLSEAAGLDPPIPNLQTYKATSLELARLALIVSAYEKP
tara:strand:+ start:244 stop:1269 length:1026 start_codon:yes stop_codon:yes gene_type:complete